MTLMEQLVEVGAHAAFGEPGTRSDTWEGTDESVRNVYRMHSRVALAALLAKPISMECETCHGEGWLMDSEGEPCPRCQRDGSLGGSGSIEVELMVGEQVGITLQDPYCIGREFDDRTDDWSDTGWEPVYRKVSLEGAT